MKDRQEELIDQLQLIAHHEGGYYKEVYRSSEWIKKSNLPARFSNDCVFSTAIYYLLSGMDFSAFHRIRSDEIWHFYEGSTLCLYIINSRDELEIKKLGRNAQGGERFQIVVPALSWFAARLENNSHYALTGCTVAPGFNFSDFQMASQSTLIAQYPQHQKIITELTRQ